MNQPIVDSFEYYQEWYYWLERKISVLQFDDNIFSEFEQNTETTELEENKAGEVPKIPL